jgi:thiol-disulfide isomerase/thioredoxin
MRNLIKRVTFILLMCGIVKDTIAQQRKIGEYLPLIKLDNVINYSHSSIDLSQYEGKVLILDFWATNCLSCITAFPVIDSLQQTFKNDVQIILINQESKDSTERFFAKRKHLKLPRVPFVTGDSILSNFFPQNFHPWHVWIDKNGQVKYITNGTNATVKNLKEFLLGKDLNFEQLNFVSESEDFRRRSDQARLIDSALCYSYLSFYNNDNPVYSNYTGYNKNGKIIISRQVASMIDLYKVAFTDKFQYDHFNLKNSVVLEIKDSSKLLCSTDEDLANNQGIQNLYSYELAIPQIRENDVFNFMQQELKRYFGFDAKVEKRKIKCYKLVRVNRIDKIKSKGGSSVDSLFKIGGRINSLNSSSRYLKNSSFDIFFNRIKYWIEYHSGTSLVDETGYKGNIDIQLAADAIDYFNLYKLKQELLKYDLDIKESKCLLEVLVIKDNN